MQEIVQAALNFLFVPYVYGGKNYFLGLDCSGLVSEILKMTPVVPYDFNENSQGIYEHFKDKADNGVMGPGSLAFYGKDINNIIHVAFMVNSSTIIEAGHGTSQTLTKDEAIQREAMVRLRPINYRSDLVSILRPKYELNGLK